MLMAQSNFNSRDPATAYWDENLSITEQHKVDCTELVFEGLGIKIFNVLHRLRKNNLSSHHSVGPVREDSQIKHHCITVVNMVKEYRCMLVCSRNTPMSAYIHHSAQLLSSTQNPNSGEEYTSNLFRNYIKLFRNPFNWLVLESFTITWTLFLMSGYQSTNTKPKTLDHWSRSLLQSSQEI